MTDDDEDTLLLGDISECPAAEPSQSPRTSNLPWVNKYILGSKPSPDPSKSPPKQPDNISKNKGRPPQEPEVSTICRHCNVKFADSNALTVHLMEMIDAVNKTPKRKIETAKDGKKCQLTKKSKVSKVVKRRREERIWEARDRENKASTSKTHSTHQTSSTHSLAHETMNKNKTLKIARELQVEASTSNQSHSTHQISSNNSHGQTSNKILKANSKNKTDRRNENVQKLDYYYKCKNCNKYYAHENNMKEHMVTNHPDQKHMFEKIEVKIQKTVEVPSGLDRQKVSSTKKKLTSMSKDIPNKNNKIPKKRDHKQSPKKTVTFSPEIKESLSLQNKPSSSREPDLVNQNDVVHAANKNSTSIKRAMKNNPTKIVNKVRFSHCPGSKGRAPRKVTSTEKIKLFKSSCGLHFTSYESIQHHVDECSGSCDTPKSNCKMCGYLFPANLVIAHLSEHHNNNNQINYDVVKLSLKSILHCTTCEKKFTYKKAYRNHVLLCTHKVHPKSFRTLNVLYKCSPCNIHYRTQQGLKQHVNRDHSDRGRTQKCDACNILLIGKAYSHHMEIQHKVMEYELKDLCIKYDKNDSRTQTNNKTIDQSLHNNNKPMKNTMNGSVARPAKSDDLNMEHANDRHQSLHTGKTPSNKISTKDCISKPVEIIEKANDNIIPTANETNEEPYETTDISPTILYKCQKCNVHFVTKTALKNHISQKNCPDIKTSDEVGICLKCQLVFYAESVIEHLATQHIGNSIKSSDDFVIICNETIENQSYDTPSKQTDNITKESMRATKRLTNPDETEVPPSKKITFETDDDNHQKNDKTESVKSLAEAWIRKMYPDMSNVTWIDFDSYSNLLYRCHKCSLNFLNDVQIKMHLSKCDGKSDEWHQCPMCSYSFSKLSLKLHVYIHHAKLEMKRENFEIVSSESRLNCPTTANDCISAKEQHLKSPQIVNNHDQRGANVFINGISKNNSDITAELSDEVGISECVDSLYETKDILSNNKSSRAKIAYAIESIDYPNEYNDIKPSVKIYEANSIPNEEEVNDYVNTKKNENLNSSSSLLKQDVLNATVHISSTLAVNPILDKPNDQIAENEEDVSTDKLFEDIDSLVASLDSPKLSKKKIVLFKCHICPIHFMTKKTLELHILNRSHDENGKKCNYCNLIFHRYSIKRHMTNHHEKYNQTVKFFIKTLTAKKPSVIVSEFFKKNQKASIDLTQKQKTNINKLHKSSIKTNVTQMNVKGSLNNTKNPGALTQMSNDHVNIEKNNCADNYLSNYTNPNPQNNDPNIKLGASNPNVPTSAKNSINNNEEIIDLCNSQSVDPEGELTTEPVTSLKSLTKDSLNNCKPSVTSNRHIDNLTKVTNHRTKSQEERYGQNEITSNNDKSSKTATININTATNDKNESGITIVENNIDNKSEHCLPSYLQLNDIDIVPIIPKASPDIETKTQQRSAHQHILPKLGTGQDEEKSQEKHLKQSNSRKSTNESQSPITTGTLSNQKSQRAPFTRFVFEDSSFEIREVYENDDSSHKIHEEYSKKQEIIERKSSDNPRESNEFLTVQNQQTTPTVNSSNNTTLTNPIDIIDITEETIDNAEMQNKNSTKNSTVQHGRDGNMSTAFTIQNRRKSIATNGSGIPNTPKATLQPTPNNNTEMPRKNISAQHGKLPNNNNAIEQNMNTAFGVQNRRKSSATNGSGIPNTPMATLQSTTNNNTEMPRKNITEQHGRLPNNNDAFAQNMSTAFSIQNRRKSVATGIPNNTPVAPPQPTTNNTEMPRNNSSAQHGRLPNNNNAFEQNNTAFGIHDRRKSFATNGSGMTVAPPQPATSNNTTVQHGRLLNNYFEQNMNTAFGIQNRRKSIASSGIPNTPMATLQPTTNNNTEMPRNNSSAQHNSFEQNNTAFGLHDRRKSVATNDSCIPNTTVAPPQPAINNNRTAHHGRLPNNYFNLNAAFGTQNRRQSIPTIGSGIPYNTPMAPSQPVNLNPSNFLNQSFLQSVALLQSQQYLQFPQSVFHNIQNQSKTNPNQNKKRQTKTQKAPKVPDIFDTMTSCPICKCNDRVSSIRKHLKVRGKYFNCCFCARRSVNSVLETHIKECGSRLNFSI